MTITTKRLTLADVKELNAVSMFRPSELKNNWVKIYYLMKKQKIGK